MHQTRKGNQGYFGLKAHLGVDRDSKLVPTVVVPVPNVADLTQTAARLHGQEQQVQADAGYTGVEKRPEIVALARKIDDSALICRSAEFIPRVAGQTRDTRNEFRAPKPSN